ncbi:MAG: VOC family protein [Thermoflexibacter sp.]|jgi:glyoxylase I family protein|nr:VOC family protein [Thermoflexibacter sp.]
MKIKGIDHAAVAAEDVEKLADWYCEILGYEKFFKHPKPVWLLKAPDGTLLEIMPKDDTPKPMRTTWTAGWSHIALRVEDLDEFINYLDTKGIQWGNEIINAIGGGRVRNFYDPEGNMLQILQR